MEEPLQNGKQIKQFEKNNQSLELVKLLSCRDCQVLKTGYNKVSMIYYFCSCDPDENEPMCLDCFNTCHSEHQKKEIISYQVNSVCQCGLNYHRLERDIAEQKDSFDTNCLFMEWSEKSKSNIYYHSKSKNLNFCVFCANFCEKVDDLEKKQNDKSVQHMKCQCSGEIHLDVKNIIKKVLLLKNFNEYELHVDDLTPTHFLNLITMSKNSFHNTFKSLTDYLTKLKNDLKKEENFLVDSNISNTSMMKGLETLSTFVDCSTEFYYFNHAIDEFLNKRFIFNLLQAEFDYKTGKNIWILKNHIFKLYHKLIFLRDFESQLTLTIKDLENLHPLQRLLYLSTSNTNAEIYSTYFGNLKFNHLAETIKVMEILTCIPEKNETVYEILTTCYEIILLYASKGQISNEFILQICNINDDLISGTEINKKTIPILLLRSQLKSIIPLIKSLLYMVYYHNDEMVESYLTNKKTFQK
jgi:hypothetical protein